MGLKVTKEQLIDYIAEGCNESKEWAEGNLDTVLNRFNVDPNDLKLVLSYFELSPPEGWVAVAV